MPGAPSSFLFLVVQETLVASLLLVAMPGAPSSDARSPSSFLFLVVQETLVASLLLVAMPGAPSSDARSP